MDYTLQQLRYLVAVADHGSVSAAARSLYVSQPGVSAAVSYLESVFGVQCFVRHHAKGVTLTPAGHSFVAAAKNVLAQAQGLHHHADELSHTIHGRITVGCFSTLGAFFLPKILHTLRSSYPELTVQILDGDTESLLRWLREGTIEVGLMYDINCDPPRLLETPSHFSSTLCTVASISSAGPKGGGQTIRHRERTADSAQLHP